MGSDLLCPWCWVGLRNLQQASKVANVDVRISWKTFMLRPNAPEDGIPKGGTPKSRVPKRLKIAGENAGINFTGLTDRTPNTSLFHATMHYLDGHESQTKFHEAVFDAYFTRGMYPDQNVLLKCAENVGVGQEVSLLYKDTQNMDALRAKVEEEAYKASYNKGVSGVPSFEFNDNFEFSGAQDVTTFVSYLNKYAARGILLHR